MVGPSLDLSPAGTTKFKAPEVSMASSKVG